MLGLKGMASMCCYERDYICRNLFVNKINCDFYLEADCSFVNFHFYTIVPFLK